MATNNIPLDPPLSSPDVPIALQLSTTLQMVHNVDVKSIKIIETPGISQPKLVKFSQDGRFLGCIDSTKLTVFQLSDYKIIFHVKFTKEISIKDFSFSPKSTFIVTYEQYTVHHKEQKLPNINVCMLDPTNEFDGLANPVKLFLDTQSEGWEPQWTDDESLFVKRFKGTLTIIDTTDWTSGKSLDMKNLSCFKLSKQYIDTPHLAIFVKGYQSVPCSACIYKHRSLGAPIANKTFFNSDSASLHWNHSSTALLVIAHMDSANNYYGGQSLYYLNSEGSSRSIDLDKKGPIYSVDWHPSRNEFAVVYGLMPSRARIYNHKCEPLITLPDMHRNVVMYNPQGNLLCFAGFGGLKGVMEFWDAERRRKISSAEATDTTYCEWCPDGSRFLTATLSPRLFEGNGFKIWNFKGELLNNYLAPEREHFWSITWRPFLPGVFPSPCLGGVKGTVLQKDSKTYVPPNLRDKGAAPPTKDKLDEKVKKKKSKDAKSDGSGTGGNAEEGSKADLDKRLRNLNKKLKEIEKLKGKRDEGKVLEQNQELKIANEAEILAQIEALNISDVSSSGPRGDGVRSKYEDTTPDNWRRAKVSD